MGWEALELKIKNLTAGRLENSFFDKASSITKNVLGFWFQISSKQLLKFLVQGQTDSDY